MKIELIKELQEEGSFYYYTKVNGKFVAGSVRKDEEEARKIFDMVVLNKGVGAVEIIETVEV